jgi:hypothetical protein
MNHASVNQEDIKKLIKEAQRSFRILISYVGQLDSRANVLLLKWPDAMLSLVSNESQQFKQDMAELICQPLVVLAEALTEMVCKEDPTKPLVNVVDVRETYKTAKDNPLEARDNLIRICDNKIFRLKSLGMSFHYIGEIT